MGKIVASWAVRITARQVEVELPENADVQTPTNEGIEKVVEEALAATWPWLVAKAVSERLDI